MYVLRTFILTISAYIVFKDERHNFVIKIIFNVCNSRDSDGKLGKCTYGQKKAIITSFNQPELVSDESQTFIQFN